MMGVNIILIFYICSVITYIRKFDAHKTQRGVLFLICYQWLTYRQNWELVSEARLLCKL